MIRGTTPTHTWELPFDVSMAKKVKVIYGQNGKKLFAKEKNDCVLSGNLIEVKLTQEETYKFDSRFHAQVQIRVVFEDGSAVSSTIMDIAVGESLEEEVLE